MSGDRRQIKDVEATIDDGLAKMLDALAGAMPGIGGAIVRGAGPPAVEAMRAPLLDLLKALGVDTSAHVRAPAVEVHVHRRPGHDEDV